MADAAVNRKREMDPTGEAKRLRSDLVENDDVVAEILVRLPVKSLIRFRCVCKSWRALISAPYFVNRHLRRGTTGLSKNRCNLLLPGTSLKSVDYDNLLKYFEIGDLEFDYPVFVFRNLAELLFESNVDVGLNDWPENIVPKCIQIYGSCNGLICVEFDYNHYINILVWNPYYGESKLLPKHNVCNDVTTDMYGFGYDSSSGDYKVVRGSWSNDGGSVVEVFTLKTGLWRQWCVDFVLDGQGCFLNGALHWVQLEWEDWEYIVGAKIVSFDLAEEKFEEMAQCPDPLAECEECYCSVGIGVIEDCLTICIEPNESDFSIWMMKEYRVKESWNEVVSISREALPKELNLSLRPLSISSSLRLRPLSISEDGEVFLNLNRNLFMQSFFVSPVIGHLAKQTWEQHVMGRRMNTNSSKILLPIPLYSVDYEALLKYVKEVDVHLASKYFDYPILIRNLNQLFSGYATSREFDCPVVVPKFSVQIYGSCNGLICLEVDYNKIIWWNPCTGDSKLLPEATHFYDDQCARYYGFGYDSTSSDYKGYLVNDVVHWVEHEYEDMGYITADSKIVSFNLREEKFQEEVSFPNPPPSSGYYESVEIGAIGGCLCICFEPIDSGLRIWVMKEYGVKESWTEVLKISREVLPKDLVLQSRPLSILENGEVLLNLQNNVLALYNPKRKTFRTVVQTHDDQWLNTAIYVETLVSPATACGVGMSRARSARASNLNQIQHANSIVIFTASSYSRGGGRGRGCSFHFHLHNQHYRKTIIIFAASFVSQIHHQPSKRRYMLGSKEL
ncbi:hypothetical protein ACLB2K_002737 [Fragaria x ananassa]